MDEPLRVIVELEVEAESLHGTARDDRGGEVAFVGWLGLIGAIDELRHSAPGDADAEPRR